MVVGGCIYIYGMCGIFERDGLSNSEWLFCEGPTE